MQQGESSSEGVRPLDQLIDPSDVESVSDGQRWLLTGAGELQKRPKKKKKNLDNAVIRTQTHDKCIDQMHVHTQIPQGGLRLCRCNCSV